MLLNSASKGSSVAEILLWKPPSHLASYSLRNSNNRAWFYLPTHIKARQDPETQV